LSKVKRVKRKSFVFRYSGRSSDYIAPSFGYGCLYKCSYCYMRRNVKDGLSVATNTINILKETDKHCKSLGVKKPNQTSDKYWTYDISCNEDFALHSKYYDWKYIFGFYKTHPMAMATLATKCVNNKLLTYDPNRKVRVRFSLMPQAWSDILEPNTSKIIDRIKAVNNFHRAGYDVHLNFSPVIVHDGSRKLYTELFNQVNDIIDNRFKPYVKAEVIFLTHNVKMHKHNLKHDAEAEKLLWKEDIQEAKTSQYGGNNLRYKHELKSMYIDRFKKLHNSIISWNKIRYIF
jgi:spore photoproduct lyase